MPLAISDNKPVDKKTIFSLGIISAIGHASLSILLPAIPSISETFNVSTEMSQLLLSLGFIMMGLGHFCFGLLADRMSHYKLLMSAMVAFALSNLLMATAQSFELLILGRILQAGSGSACFTLSRIIALSEDDRDTAAKNLSYIILPITLVPLIAPPIGGILTDLLNWRWVFYLSSFTGVIGIFLIFFLVPKTSVSQAKNSEKTLSNIKTLLLSREFNCYNGHHCFTVAATYAINAATPFIIITSMGYSPSEFGTFAMLPALGSIVGAFLGARLVKRMGGDSLIIYGSIIAISSYGLILVSGLLGALSPWSIYLPMIMISFTNTLLLPSSTTGALTNHPGLSGTGSGLMGITQWILTGILVQLTATQLEHSEITALAIAFICYLVAVGCFYAARK